MFIPALKDLTALRNAPFDATIAIVGFDYTGASLVRFALFQNADDIAAVLTLDTATVAPAEGWSMAVVTTNGVPTTTFTIRINKSTIDTHLPWPANGTEPGATAVLNYHFMVTKAGVIGGVETRWQQGRMIYQPKSGPLSLGAPSNTSSLQLAADNATVLVVQGADLLAPLVASATASAATATTKAAETVVSATGAAASAASIGAGGGAFGEVLGKLSATAGDVAFVGRQTLNDTPVGTVDLTNGASRQILISDFTTPASRVTATVVSSELRLTAVLNAVFLGTAATAERATFGRTITMAARTVTVNGTFSNLGFGFVLSPAAPTLGGATAVLNAGAIYIGLRSNGVIETLGRDGFNVAAGVAATPNNVVTPWVAGQTITATARATNLAGTAVLVTFFADGTALQTVAVTGCPANGYAAAAVRFAGTDTVAFPELTNTGGSIDLEKRIYLDPNNAGVAIGTEANPFTTLAQALVNADSDTFRRTLRLTLKRGVYRGSLGVSGARWRKITVEAVGGHGAIIRPSVAITGAQWTLIAGTELWYTANRWPGGAALGIGGVIETTVGVTQAFGRTGLVTITGRALYTRLGSNLATNATVARGAYSTHTTGIYAGNIVVRCYDGGDPNAKIWEFATASDAIAVTGGLDTDWNGSEVVLRGIECQYALNRGVWLQRVPSFVLENVAVRGNMQSYAYHLDEATGRAYGCVGEGSYSDVFNNGGGLSSDATRRTPVIEFDSCDALGSFTTADSWSNHRGSRFHMRSCRAWSPGKDGLSAIDNFRLIDFDARDAINAGVVAAPEAGQSLRGSILGGRFIGNHRGVLADTAANVGTTALVDVQGAFFQDQVRSSVETFVNGAGSTATINAYASVTRTTGAAPTAGHVAAGGGAINVLTGTALA